MHSTMVRMRELCSTMCHQLQYIMVVIVMETLINQRNSLYACLVDFVCCYHLDFCYYL